MPAPKIPLEHHFVSGVRVLFFKLFLGQLHKVPAASGRASSGPKSGRRALEERSKGVTCGVPQTFVSGTPLVRRPGGRPRARRALEGRSKSARRASPAECREPTCQALRLCGVRARGPHATWLLNGEASLARALALMLWRCLFISVSALCADALAVVFLPVSGLCADALAVVFLPVSALCADACVRPVY